MTMKYVTLALIAASYLSLQSCTIPNFAASAAKNSPTITNADLPNGTIGKKYEVQVSASGGTPPYSWRISSGKLPPGLTLNAANGVISGTPTTAGWSDFFTLRVQDASGSAGSLSYSIIINPVFDQYGGSPSLPCHATGWFHAEKIGHRWLFCDPDGSASFRVSVGAILAPDDGRDPKTGQTNNYRAIAKLKYRDLNAHWAPQQVRRIQAWGFNTVGQLSFGYTEASWKCGDCEGWRNGEQPVKLPSFEEQLASNYAAFNLDNHADHPTKDMMYGVNENYKGWRASFLDFFDYGFAQWIERSFSKSDVRDLLNSHWLTGVSIDDSDYVRGVGAGPDFPSKPPGKTDLNVAYMVMITSPMQTFNPNVVRRGIGQIYLDSNVYSKVALPSPPLTCSIATPCSLRDYLYKKYKGDIKALNSAWETSGYYTTFDSSGTQVKREVIGVGDGRTLSFTHMLARTPVSPESVLIALGDKAQGGDCPWWIEDCKIKRASMGSIQGPESTTTITGDRSTIDYSKGQLTTTFKTPPPAGQQITVDYVSRGWMYGTGLMDEDGRHKRWLGSNSICLEPAVACNGNDEPLPDANSAVAADLDAWISQFSAQYFKSCRAGLKKNAPQLMYFGVDTLGTWRTPARREILEGAAPYVDGIVAAVAPDQERTDYIEQYLGDKPIFLSSLNEATPDSSLFRYATSSDQPTQEAKAQAWFNDIRRALLLRTNVTGTYPFIGVSWWGMVDFWNEKTNWGLVSLNDNPYDGKSAVRVARKDQWGYPTGGEERDYGDAIDYVKKANVQWFFLLGLGNPPQR